MNTSVQIFRTATAISWACGWLGSTAGMALAAEAGDVTRNWPSWRGPLATGVAPQAKPPLQWSEEKNLRWKVTLPGRGTASPVVWDDLVFILTAIPVTDAKPAAPAAKADDTAAVEGARPGGGRRRGGGGARGANETPTVAQKFTVLALDRATGKTRWEKTPRTQVPHAGHHPDHGFASASPVTDGEVLIASFGSFGIYALDLNGKVLWEKDLGDMQTRNGFGEGSSPALDGDTVVVLWDHEGADFIVALDKRTGRELWRRERDEPTGWCTPLVVAHGGRKQVVVNGTQQARGYDLATGEPLWESAGQTANAIPSAVADREHVYVMSGFRGAACQAIVLGRKGNLGGTDGIAWSLSKGTPYVPSPLLSNGRLYFYSGNNAMLSICDAQTGKLTVESNRIDGMNSVYASPVAAAGRVYLAGRDGRTVVIKDAPNLEILATNTLDDGFDATPALVGAEVFLRGRQSLYCVSESAGK